MSIKSEIEGIIESLSGAAQLVAVSKTYPAGDIREAYDMGQRIFGESRPQELVAKWEELPKDIEWRMIGHLQRNKIRMIAPFVSMIESVDSSRLAEAIDIEAARCGRVIDCLLEIHVAQEQSKTGWDFESLVSYIKAGGFDCLQHIRVRGVMGIATYTDDEERVRADFMALRGYKETLAKYFPYPEFDTLSMGMSGDYMLAVECGSTSVRVGSKIFGARYYK